MPIASDVSRVLAAHDTPRKAFKGLLRVEAGAESEPG
jgi:glycerol-3-phosphate dehydrogenase (NAD(P)+)